MPSFLSRLFTAAAPARAIDQKASRAGALLALHSVGLSRYTPRDNVELARHGYERNPIVHRCVRMVAEAAASIPWRVYVGRDEHPEHPVLALLARPNPSDVGPAFLEALISNQLLFGNAYVEASLVDGSPRELYALRPDRMHVAPGRNGWPTAYEYTVMGDIIRYEIPVAGVAPILHLKLFHPLDDHYGFAPLRAAQNALDVHNAAAGWNKALLDNSARPSGALVYTSPQGLSEEQFDRLKAELDENFSGARNAGRPLLLEGGLDWKALSLSPKDMDFIEAKSAAAREIALAFGVPPLLLGLPGDNTRANFEEANRAFWRQTVIPQVARMQKSFAAWLHPAFGDFVFDYDVDRIDALASERVQEWTRIGAADFLTADEKREAVGYGPMPRIGKEFDAVSVDVGNSELGAGGGSTDASTGAAPGNNAGAWQNQPRVPAGNSDGGEWRGQKRRVSEKSHSHRKNRKSVCDRRARKSGNVPINGGGEQTCEFNFVAKPVDHRQGCQRRLAAKFCDSGFQYADRSRSLCPKCSHATDYSRYIRCRRCYCARSHCPKRVHGCHRVSAQSTGAGNACSR